MSKERLYIAYVKGSNLLEGLTAWLTSCGTILPDVSHNNEHTGVRIVTVR